MYDLFIIECLITLFSALAIVQPFVQVFRKIAGLAVLPIIALLLSMVTLPAFGFRPELLPLAIFTLVSSIGSIPHLSDMARKLRTDDFDGRIFVLALIKLVLLLFVALFAFLFLPKVEPVGWIVEPIVDNVTQAIIMKETELIDESRDVRLNVRFYYPNIKLLKGSASTMIQAQLPIIVVACPILGGLPFYEEYCSALAARGFLVSAFTRKSDSNLGTNFRLYQDLITSTLFSGRTMKADVIARSKEQDSLSDIGFFMRFLKSAVGKNMFEDIEIDNSNISVAGFGSGGAAALIYGAQSIDSGKMVQDDFPTSVVEPEVIASICLEGPPASFRETEIRMNEGESLSTENATLSNKTLSAIRMFFRRILRKTGFEGYRFVGKVPETRIPSLILVSDKIGNTDARDGRYAVLLRFLLGAKAMSAIVSFDGAGILDFTDAPRKYPLFSAFTPGIKSRDKTAISSYAIKAADASVAFISLAIGRKLPAKVELGYYENEPGADAPKPTWLEFSSSQGISIEMGGEW